MMRIATQIDVRSKSGNRGFALPRKKFFWRNEAPTGGTAWTSTHAQYQLQLTGIDDVVAL